MAQLLRKFQKIFGGTAGAGQIGKFGSFIAGSPQAYSGAAADPDNLQALPNYLGGWFSAVAGNSNPAIEDMNALFFLITYQLSYIFQDGVPAWEAQTTYYEHSYAKSSTDGKLYRSIQANNTNHALTDAAWWTLASSGGGLVNANAPDLATLSSGNYYQANSQTGAIGVSIASGVVGGNFVIVDVGGNAEMNNITILPAVGQKLNGVTNGSLTISRSRSGYWISWDVANSSWQATPIGAGAGGLIPRNVAANVTVARNDLLMVDSTLAARTISTPVGTTGSQFFIGDAKRTAGTNAITINPPSGTNFVGLGTNVAITININGGYVWFVWNGSNYMYFTAGTGSGGGLTPVAVSASGTCTANTLEDCDVTAGTITRTLPPLPTTGQSPITIRILDSERQASTTKKIICAPSSGQAMGGLVANATLDIDYVGGWIEFNAAPNATFWKVTTQATTTIQPGFQRGYTGGVAITAGNIGEEIIQSFSNFTPPANTVAANIGFFDLTEGTWDAVGYSIYGPGTAAGNTYGLLGVSTTSASVGGAYSQISTAGGTVSTSLISLPQRFNVAVGATLRVYLVAQHNFTTVGTSAFQLNKLRFLRVA